MPRLPGVEVAPWLIGSSTLSSMATLHEQSLGAQCLGEALLDVGGLSPRNALQVKHRAGEHLDPALEHAAGRADTRLVLVEASAGE